MDMAGQDLDEMEAYMASLSDDELEVFKEEQAKYEAERIERLSRLGETVAKLRAEAIDARKRSGIEDVWLEDEEFYEGIDDANRGEMAAWSSKPPGREAIQTDDTSSTIFLNVTGPYVDAAAASLADMLLPTDDSAWHITNTPVPELIPFAKGEIPAAVKSQIRQEAAQIAPDDPESFAQETEGKMVEKAKSMLDEAKDKADKAQKRIEDWHVECQYHAEVRKVIEDAAKVGSGVLKGPFPMRKRQIAYKNGSLVINEEIKPVSKRIDYKNLYPDGGCGDSIHNGGYVFERDDITAKQLRELIGVPGYIESEILAVLDEGPTEAGRTYVESVDDMKRRDTKNLYEIWYFYGDISKEDIEAAGCECDPDMPDSVPAQITMINNHVIKASLNHLDSGEFPYDVMVWKKRNGMPWGTGIARLIRTPQRMINGAARNLMDNAGLAGGPMWAFKQGILEPIDGVAELAPRKGWIAAEDATFDDVSKAFTYFKLDMMVNELQAIIYLGLKMAEDVTGLPMIMQGQMGAQKLDTLGQTQLLNNNANIVRRRIARLFDDLVTEPHVRRYYAYLLQYGESDDEKGEFIIDARGSSNLVERAIQKEKTMQWLEMAQNPVYGIDPKKVAKELLRADKFDPKAFEYDDEEWREIVANLAQPQNNDPRQAIAEINAQIAQMKEEGATARMEMQIQSKERVAAFQAEVDQALEEFKGNLDKELTEMKYRGDKDKQFDALKTRLNETVMKLTTTRELAGVKAPADQMPAPVVEPPQRAPVGQSYQQ